jgi:BirA family biotin operon repressor/biotin-[acetyl-CoA-carboxylase] ligase
MFPSPVYLCGELPSVLDAAHEFAALRCLPVWGSVLARCQSRGRGQFRRRWSSPPGNIYAALRLPPAAPFDSGAASPAVGALLAEAFAAQGVQLALKWPNDLLLPIPAETGGGWGKVGGVLLEERGGALIAGMGINISSAPGAGLVREGGLPAISLRALNGTTAGEEVVFLIWCRLVESLAFCYQEWGTLGENAWRAAAERRLVWRGERVLLDDGEEYSGILLGLASDGALRLLCGGIERRFANGTLKAVS